MKAWRPGPLKRWLVLNDSGIWGDDPSGVDDVVVLRSTDIRLDGSWRLNDPATRSIAPEDREAKTLRAGDLVVVKSSGSAQHLGKTALVTPEVTALMPCFANFVQRLRPGSDADPRYVWYLLNSHRASAEMEELGATTTGLRNLKGSIIGSVVFPGPPLAEQQAIADFLDAETSRIDALIAKKRRLLEVLVELRWSCFESALSRHGVVVPDSVDPAFLRDAPLPRDWVAVKLSSILRQLTNGYVGPTRDILRDDGVRYIQGLHIKQGVIDFERRPYFVEEAWHDAHPRTALRSGDVLIVQTGDIGQVAVVPEDFGAANCHALLIARANKDVVSGLYLGAYLQSRFGYHSLVRVATGALHPHLEFSIRDVPVLVPPKRVQDDLVREVSERQSKIDRVVGLLARQTDLLAERRQALITAAVTGELDLARHLAKAAS